MTNKFANYIKPDEAGELDALALLTPFIEGVFQAIESETILEEQFTQIVQVFKSFPYRLYQVEKKLVQSFSEKEAKVLQEKFETVKGINYTYEQLEGLGFNLVGNVLIELTPWQHLQQVHKDYKWSKLGLSISDNNKIQFNANVFIRHVLSRIDLVQDQDSKVYIYNMQGMYEPITDAILKALCKAIFNEAGANFWKRAFETEYFAVLKNEIPFELEFDHDKDIINFANGLFSMKDFKLIPHNNEYRSIFQLPYEYDASAKCPKFESFLESIFEGDEERISLVQEILGYLWIKEIKLQKAFIFLGHGSNGKSVLAKVIREMIGVSNVSSVGLKRMQGNFGLQEFPNKLVNISSENEFADDFTTENFKLITSGDSLSVERKNRDSFTTTLYVKLILLLNKMMESKDTSHGFLRRLVIIPFNKRYEELLQGMEPEDGVEYMNPELENELVEELSGIFNYSMLGLQRLKNNGFKLTQSKEVEEALATYKANQNSIIKFVSENVLGDSSSKILRKEAYDNYLAWCSKNDITGSKVKSRQVFHEYFQRICVENKYELSSVKNDGNYYYKGIGFKNKYKSHILGM